jgi:hypothetical protein
MAVQGLVQLSKAKPESPEATAMRPQAKDQAQVSKAENQAAEAMAQLPATDRKAQESQRVVGLGQELV